MELFYKVAPLVGFSLNIILAFLVLRQHLHSRLHQVFTIFLVSMGLWAFAAFGMRVSPTLERALPWEKAIFIVLPFVSVSFYHFVLIFTRTPRRLWQLRLAYLIAIFSAGLSFTDLIIQGMREMWYGHGFVPGLLFMPYMVIFYGFVIIALFLLVKAYRSSGLALEKTRYLYVAIGASLCLLGLIFDVLAARGTGTYPLGIVSNIIFSAICTYAIMKYHLLDIHLVVRKGTAYVIVSAIGSGLYIGLLFIAYFFITHAWSLPIWLNISFILIIAVGLQPALQWAQKLVDKWFYRGRYDYLVALDRLSGETKAITDLAFIAGSLVDTVVTAMRCKNVFVLLPDVDDKYFVPVAYRGETLQHSIRIQRESALVSWLNQKESFLTRQDINITPQLQALTARERGLLDDLEAELLVPLITREGIRGMLILGPKLSGEGYSAEEVSMLRVVTRQMATVLDNARLYDLQLRRYQEQALLARLGMVVASELDVNKICTLFIKEMKKFLPVDYVNIKFVEEKEKAPLTSFIWTKLPTLRTVAKADEIKPEEEFSLVVDRDIHSELKIVLEGKFLQDERFRKSGIKSVVSLTLQSQRGILGYCVLAARKARAYYEDNLRLLQQVAIQLAIAIDKSRLYELERKAHLELEKQYEERTDLINSLIHEVKTPITAMLASSELLREELSSGSPDLSDLAENLDVSTRNLDRRISELVNFVKLQTGEPGLQLRPVDINRIARQAASHMAGLLRSKNQELLVELPPSLGKVKADPERLIQILLNLLTNASKFSKPNTKIYLRAHPENDFLVVELEDTAPPIKPAEVKDIFNPYHQNKSSGSGGLGLGLSICKKLVQLHGGKIWVETNGAGNKFKFSMPLIADAGGKK